MTAVNRHRYCTAEQLQEHSGAPGTVETHQFANEVSERAVEHPHTLSDLESVAEVHEAVVVRNTDQRFHDPIGDRDRECPVRYERSDTESAVDASPLVTVQIQRNEQVAVKEWRAHCRESARVAHRLSIAWKEGLKTLRGKLCLRVKFSMWLAIDDIPARALAQTRGILLREGRVLIAIQPHREVTQRVGYQKEIDCHLG